MKVTERSNGLLVMGFKINNSVRLKFLASVFRCSNTGRGVSLTGEQ